MENKFPCAVDCYLLRARDGLPPHPENEPIATVIVHSQQQSDNAKKDLKEKHPGGWVMERPIDIA